MLVKNPPANDIKDVGSIPGLGRSPGEGHGNPLQYSFLENPHRQRSLLTPFKLFYVPRAVLFLNTKPYHNFSSKNFYLMNVNLLN